jgi:diguanylate cyclase (GGDEF)-like protein
MPAIDTNTLFLVLISLSLVIAVVLAIVGKGVDNSLLIWAIAFITQSSGFVLLTLRDSIPDWLSIWLANLLIAATYSLFAVGLLKFINQRVSALLIWSPVLVMAAMYLVLLDNLGGRIIVGGAVNFSQMLILLLIMLNNQKHLIGRGKYLMISCFTAGIALSLLRPAAVVMGFNDISNYNSPGASQAATFLGITLLSVIVALAFVLMQKEHAEAATDSIARSDDLTGLPNRRRLYERIGQLMADKKSAPFSALILLDLDNFKVLNDTWGHAAGDELLKQAAARISSCVSRPDTVARLGGDEFVVLLPALGSNATSAEHQAMAVARNIKSALAKPYVLSVMASSSQQESTVEHQSTGTLGIKIFHQSDQNREHILREADKAMYSAKNIARGSIQLATVESAAAP